MTEHENTSSLHDTVSELGSLSNRVESPEIELPCYVGSPSASPKPPTPKPTLEAPLVSGSGATEPSTADKAELKASPAEAARVESPELVLQVLRSTSPEVKRSPEEIQASVEATQDRKEPRQILEQIIAASPTKASQVRGKHTCCRPPSYA